MPASLYCHTGLLRRYVISTEKVIFWMVTKTPQSKVIRGCWATDTKEWGVRLHFLFHHRKSQITVNLWLLESCQIWYTVFRPYLRFFVCRVGGKGVHVFFVQTYLIINVILLPYVVFSLKTDLNRKTLGEFLVGFRLPAESFFVSLFFFCKIEKTLVCMFNKLESYGELNVSVFVLIYLSKESKKVRLTR